MQPKYSAFTPTPARLPKAALRLPEKLASAPCMLICIKTLWGSMSLFLESDQTRCYDANGHEQPCAASGQDASFAKRQTLAARFATQGGIVIDQATGLAWLGRADTTPFPVTWQEAQNLAAAMAAESAHGLSGWRLPQRRELFSLISHQYTKPALPAGHPFLHVFSGAAWTADRVKRLPEQAWQVHVGDGRLIKANAPAKAPADAGKANTPADAGKADEALFWPVCSYDVQSQTQAVFTDAHHPAPRGPRFSVGADCARDTLTGLVWMQNPGLSGPAQSWTQALAWVAALNERATLGRSDWRLPTIRELESLTDLAAHSPALPPEHPFMNLAEGYWSSTTSVYESRYAWAWYARDGFVGVGFKADAAFHAWAVHGPV